MTAGGLYLYPERDGIAVYFGGDRAAVGFGGGARDRKADARAADARRMRFVRAVKPVEEPRHVDALRVIAGIGNGDLIFPPGAARRKGNTAVLRRVFIGVIQQDGNHLLHRGAVARHGETVLNVLRVAPAAGAGERGKRLGGLPHGIAERKFFPLRERVFLVEP